MRFSALCLRMNSVSLSFSVPQCLGVSVANLFDGFSTFVQFTLIHPCTGDGR